MVKSLDHVKNWQGFTAESIPTKSSTPALDTFIQQLESGSRVLDCGCGCGAISRQMASLGFSVVGIDINPNAIQHAQAFAHERLCFSLTNIASDDLPAIGGAPFDAVVCQLLISIVGGITDRVKMLRNCYLLLKEGGSLYLSASGISDAINESYAELYQRDEALTGEPYSYVSRNASGDALYLTHHFSDAELNTLLRETGFSDIEIVKKREASSRRPSEAAYFYYATCRRPVSRP